MRLSSNSTVSGSFTAAELSRMRNGHEYQVDWSPDYGKWVFTAHDSRIYNDVSTLKVIYHWDYKRDFGDESHVSGVFLTG